MKKNLFAGIKTFAGTLALLFFAAVLCTTLTGCPSAEGLHNQNSAQVTFVFTGFSSADDGAYTVPGNFNSWDNSSSMLSLKAGEGTSASVTVSTANIQFTLVPVGSWTRAWYPAVQGNGVDNTSGKYQNFYINSLDLDAGEITVVVDASTGTATPVAQ